jgi:hypothetical protein
MEPSKQGAKRFLSRARELRSEIADEVAGNIAVATSAADELQPEVAVRRLLKSLGELEHSLESPGRLFEQLVEHLRLRKAALLLPDHQSDRFLVWSALGIDKTTQQRLRPREEELETIFTAHGEDVLILAGDELRGLTGYLSHRERDTLEQVALFPFRHGRQTLAVLFILESPYLALDPAILRILLAALADMSGRLFFSNRDIPISRARRSVLFNRQEIAETIDRLASTGDETTVATVLQIDVSEPRDRVIKQNPLLDPFRVTQDIVTIMAALLAGEGFAGLENGNKVVVVLPGEAQTDRELLMHQLRHSLVTLFRELTQPPELSFEEVTDLPAFVDQLRS